MRTPRRRPPGSESPTIPIHPGEILREEFLVPLALSAGRLAEAVKVPRTRIERLMREETAVTADTALRLSRYFGTTPGFWMNLQSSFDLAAAAPDIAEIEPRAARGAEMRRSAVTRAATPVLNTPA